MVVSGAVLIACFVLSIIRAPSDEDVIKEINSFHESFNKRINTEIELNNYKNVEILKGYKQQGRMLLKKRVGDHDVYPCIMDVAIAVNGTDYYIYSDELYLLAPKESKVKKVRIDRANVTYSVSPLSGNNTILLEVVVVDQNEFISFIVDNDYHFRNFESLLKKIE